MTRGSRAALFALALLPAGAARAHAQCPDGTPPPCNRAAAGRPAPRRDPPLDDRFWLVLPFTNTTGAADAELVSAASVNLLYQDLSRWQDIRVVPDDRVADLVRSLPATERTRPGLESSLSLARRVGAGNLLMGDYLAVGGRVQLTAKVYHVQSGRQVRLVRDQLNTLSSLDSLTSGFSRIARGALDVRGPARLTAGAGTTSLAAYSAYIAGLQALHRLEIDSANRLFVRATVIDSTFALAHLRASQTIIRFVADGTASDPNRDAALRFSEALPPRERALVRAYAASTRADLPELCRQSEDLLRADSSDAEAWVIRSGCFSDFALVVPPGGDSSRAVTRGDVGQAYAALKRARDLDPGGPYSRSYGSMHTIGHSVRCLTGITGACGPRQTYAAIGSIENDSLRYTARRWPDVRHAPPWLEPLWVAGYQGRLTQVRDEYRRMNAASATPNWILELITARLSCQVGDTTAGAAGYRRAVELGPDSLGIGIAAERRDLALMRQRVAEAVVLAESALTLPPNQRNVSYFTMLGRLGEGADSSPQQRALATWRQVLVGVLPDGFEALEAGIAGQLTGAQREDFLQLTTLAAFHLRRGGPALDTAARHPVKRFQAWLHRGDTAKARAALAEFDRELLARHRASLDDGGWLFNAESHLELGDTATALARLVEWERRWPFLVRESYVLETFYYQRTTVRLFGRTWLLYGDVAAASGRTAEARRAYQMVAGMWNGADPVLQPTVTRVRAALARLGA